MSDWTRRQLLAGLAASPLFASAAPAAKAPDLCVFTKHFPETPAVELGPVLRDLGIAAVDLTVRPGGHILPENAARDLPRAVEALDKAGVRVSMITTGLTSAEDPAARPTLETAAKLGIGYFKLGYYRYPKTIDLERTRAETAHDLAGLARLAAEVGISGGFHNHSGAYVGSNLWDSWLLLQDTPREAVGFYFDPCHATIEGGKSGWEISFHRVAARLNMVACKDFRWEKGPDGWRDVMCPLGEGMVDYPAFFKLLGATGFAGPISLHVEYELETAKETHAAVARDFARLTKFAGA